MSNRNPLAKLTACDKHVIFYQVQTAKVSKPKNGRDIWSDISYVTFMTTHMALEGFKEVCSREPKKKHRVVRVTEEVVVQN
jgi:hypothetical protein